MAPTSAALQQLYSEYKRETKAIQEWLTSTARLLEIDPELIKSVEQGESSQDESKGQTKQKRRSGDWILITKAIVNAGKSDIPESIIHLVQSCIQSREKYSRELRKPDNPRSLEDKKADYEHIHFINILKQVLGILESGQSVTGTSSSANNKTSTNRLADLFRRLTVEEPSPEFANLFSKLAQATPQARKKADRLTSVEKKREAITKFGTMLKVMNSFLSHSTLELENLSLGCIRLETLTLVSEVRAQLVGHIIEPYIKGFESCGGAVQVAAWHFWEQSTFARLKEWVELPPWEIDHGELSEHLSLLDYMSEPTNEVMTWNAIMRLEEVEDGGRWPSWDKEPQALRDDMAAHGNDRHTTLNNAISMHGLWMRLISCRGLFQPLRFGMKDFNQYNDVEQDGCVFSEWPFRLSFSYQNLLLTASQPEEFSDKVLNSFKRQLIYLQADTKAMVELIINTANLKEIKWSWYKNDTSEAGAEEKTILDALSGLKKQIQRFMSDGLGDLMKVHGMNTPTPNWVFRQQPELCGMILMEFKVKMDLISRSIINRCSDLCDIAGLYDYLRALELIPQPWIDMEDFLAEVGNDLFFGGHGQSANGQAARVRYWTMRGGGPPFVPNPDGGIVIDPQRSKTGISQRGPLARHVHAQAVLAPQMDRPTVRALKGYLAEFASPRMAEELVQEADGSRYACLVEQPPSSGKKPHDPVSMPGEKQWEQVLRSITLHVENDIKDLEFPYMRYFESAREVTNRLAAHVISSAEEINPELCEQLKNAFKVEPQFAAILAGAFIPPPGPKMDQMDVLPGVAAVMNEFIAEKKMSMNDINNQSIPKSSYEGSPFMEDRKTTRWRLSSETRGDE